VMAIYKLLSSIFVGTAGGSLLVTGQTVTEGKELPVGFVPNGCCDPLDADGAQKMWNAGPVAATIDLFTPPPVTFWKPVAPGSAFSILTGLGASLGPKVWIDPGPGRGRFISNG
jgi:hypothetical protein